MNRTFSPNAVHLNENPVHLSLAVDKSASVSMPRKVPWADLERYVNRIGFKRARNVLGRATDKGFTAPRMELMICTRPKHIALAGLAQRHLDRAHAIDGVSRHHRRRRSVSEGAGHYATGGANGTPAAMARSIIRTASCGLVAKRTSEGTCTAASRAALLVHSFGKYSVRSMKAWPWRET